MTLLLLSFTVLVLAASNVATQVQLRRLRQRLDKIEDEMHWTYP